MDNKIITQSSAQSSESTFISKVFLWMSFGLLLSTLSSFGLVSSPIMLKILFGNQFAPFGVMLAELGLVLWLSARLQTMSSAKAVGIFCAFSILNGMTVAMALLMFTGASVMQTFAITAGTFLFFSLYGLTTKKDLTSIGSLVMMALWGVILASVVNYFVKSSGLMWIISFVGVAIFVVLVAYDTQKLKAMHTFGLDNEETEKKMVIFGALTLYLDFINLFVLLLRFFGKRRN